MLRELHLISNRAMTLGALLLLGSGILLGADPALAHRWFAVLLALEPETLRPLASWNTVGWHALTLLAGLYATGAVPSLLSRAWRMTAGFRFDALATVHREGG